DRMSMGRRTAHTTGLFVLWACVCAFHQLPQDQIEPTNSRAIHKLFRLNGKFVHNVGRLQLQITNFGETGNQSNPSQTTVPSAEWPPGSGNDYLYAAGLWIGALDASGIPHVTTATSQREFSPQLFQQNVCVNRPIEQVADVRATYEGIPNGNRVISSSVNPGDDGDGRVDEAGLVDTTVQYVGPSGDFVKRRIQMGYMWDNPDDPARPQDAKGGDVPGYFGCMFLNHTTDASGATAPRRVGITSYKFFAGSAAFAAGGDPENDAQRYLLMSDPQLNPDNVGQIVSSRPLDYRVIMATGPFRSILPDSSLTVSVAWVMGL